MSNDSILEINFNDSVIDEVMHLLDDYVEDQLPFAIAESLFDVAKDAREEMRQLLPKVFTIRTGSNPWAARALTFAPRTARDLRRVIKAGGPKQVEIYSKDEVLGRLLTDGGVKKSNVEEGFGVPIIGGGRKTLDKKLTPKTNAHAILRNNPRALMITAKNGRKLLVLRPTTYKRGIPKRQQHKAMFHMRPQVQITPWDGWDARKILSLAMEKMLPERFVQRFNAALKTRKPK